MRERFEKMGKAKYFFFIPLGLAAVAGFGAIVMLLWNALLPEIFGLRTITFWQALGLLVLSKILFSGFGGGGDGRRQNHREHKEFRERMANMSEEDRQKMREKMKERWASSEFFDREAEK